MGVLVAGMLEVLDPPDLVGDVLVVLELEQMRTVDAVANAAAKPRVGVISVIFFPTVAMTL